MITTSSYQNMNYIDADILKYYVSISYRESKGLKHKK